MAESKRKVSGKDRFMPCLLDRLIDELPYVKTERHVFKTFTIQQLKRAVLRDIRALLNTKSKMPERDFKSYPNLRASVVNYGLDNICGRAFKTSSLKEIETEIREAVERFEPRIAPESLAVKVSHPDKDASHSTFNVELQGIMNVYPLTEEVIIRSRVDVETGNFNYEF